MRCSSCTITWRRTRFVSTLADSGIVRDWNTDARRQPALWLSRLSWHNVGRRANLYAIMYCVCMALRRSVHPGR